MNRDRKLIFLTVLYFAILGCFLLGCSEGTDSSPVSALMGNIDSENYSNKITGIVLDSSNNEPLSNIYVQLYDNAEIPNFIKGELTNLDGTYTISGISNGTYTVRIHAAGYDDLSPNPKECSIFNGIAYPENYILTLNPKTDQTTKDDKKATVSGVVRRSDNSSTKDHSVILYKDKECKNIVDDCDTLVLGDGSFNFFNVPIPGNYFIKAVNTNKTEENTVYPIGIDSDGKVSPSNIVITLDIKESVATCTIDITVKSAYTGAALELATVKINGENKGTTDKKGQIIIKDFPLGDCSFEITKDGFENLTGTRQFNTVATHSLSLTMIEDTKDGYGSITGRYVSTENEENIGNGIANYYVRLYRMIERTQTNNDSKTNITETWYDVDKSFILTTKTSNNSDNSGVEGSFKLTHIEPGVYQIYISDSAAIPPTEQRSQVYDDFKWTQIKGLGTYIITQPLKVVSDQTTYWTNYEQGNN